MPPILKNSFEKMIISISDYYIASMKKGGWVSSNISSRVSSSIENQFIISTKYFLGGVTVRFPKWIESALPRITN
jgi:hypothetical protein